MSKEKDKILEAYEEMLVEGRGYYRGLWKEQFDPKDYRPMSLPPGYENVEEQVIKQHKKFREDMWKLETMVTKYLIQMDKRSNVWEKWLKLQGL
jgi:hypothetical protein